VTTWEHHVPLAFHSGREADHSPPSSAEVKEWVELCLRSPMRLHGVVLSWGGGAQGLYLYLTYIEMSLYLLNYAMKEYGGLEVQLHAHLTSAQDGS
jgi:hypothetical protein